MFVGSYPPIVPRFPADLHITIDFVRSALCSTDASSTLSAPYLAITTQLKKRDDAKSLHLLLLSLASSDSLTTISSNPTKHGQLIHSLFKLDPFVKPKKKKRTPETTPPPPTDAACCLFATYDIADAYLYLVVNLLSSNSTILLPFISMILRNMKTITMTSEAAMSKAELELEAETSSSMLEDDNKHGYNNSNNNNNNKANDNPTSTQIPTPPTLNSDDIKISKLHSALKQALKLVPKGRSEIFPIIAQNFPYKKANTYVQQRYAKECLSFISYIPSLQFPILQLIVNKCLEIDVEIKIDESGVVSVEEEEDEDFGLFKMDEDDSIIATATSISNPNAKNDKKRPRAPSIEADEYADKLDSLLLILFNYLSDCDPNLTYELLKPVFDNSILLTHKSKFTQFIFLHICGLDAEQRQRKPQHELGCTSPIFQRFISHLIGLVTNTNLPPIQRQCASSYVASFVSRTKFTSIELVCQTTAALLSFCEAFMDLLNNNQISPSTSSSSLNIQQQQHGNGSPKKRARTPSNSPPGSPRYNSSSTSLSSKNADVTLFYTVAQASFYIMCFRGSDSIKFYNSNSRNGNCDISSRRWERLVNHPLRPLRHCLESVRKEFCVLADVYQLVKPATMSAYVEKIDKMSETSAPVVRPASPIVTAATMEVKRQKGGVGGLGKGSNPLDSFFPFDPFLLRRSFPYVDKNYLSWEGSAIQYCVNSDVETEVESDGGGGGGVVGSGDDSSVTSCSSDDEEEGGGRMPQSYNSTENELFTTEEIEFVDISTTNLVEKFENEKRRARAPSFSGGGSW